MIRFLPGLCQTNSPGGGKLVMRAKKQSAFCAQRCLLSCLSETELAELTSSAQAQTGDQSQLRQGTFVRDLEGSDAFHWGDGTIYVSDERIWLDGSIAPGPDHRLYLTKGQFTTRDGFLAVKSDALQIAPIKAYKNFSVMVPDGVDIADYDAVIIWCEAFSAFVTSASIR